MSKINATLDIKFLHFTGLRDKLEEAKEKARDLDFAYICFKHQGHYFSISRLTDVETALAKYEEDKDQFKTKFIVM